MPGLLLLVIACDPLARREAAWWDAQQTDRLGVDLIHIEAGEPLAYAPRVVVTHDRISIDNRAWFLSLPEPERRPERLVEEAVLAGLEPGGRVPEAHRRGQLITPLYGALLELTEAGRQVEGFDGAIALVFASGIPYETMRAVMYTAGQGGFGTFAIVGEVDGRLRSAGAMDPSHTPCALQAIASLRAEGSHIALPGTPPLLADTCTPTPAALADSLLGLARRCQPHWGAPGACVEALLAPDEALPSDDVLAFLARAYVHHPAVRQSYLLGAAEVVSCDEGVPITELTEAQLAHVCTAGDTLGARPRWDRHWTFAWDADARAAFPAYSARVLGAEAERRGVTVESLHQKIDAPPPPPEPSILERLSQEAP